MGRGPNHLHRLVALHVHASYHRHVVFDEAANVLSQLASLLLVGKLIDGLSGRTCLQEAS